MCTGVLSRGIGVQPYKMFGLPFHETFIQNVFEPSKIVRDDRPENSFKFDKML